MLPFRCASGHEVQLDFGDEHIRLPCPTCGTDVYKYRDGVVEEAGPLAAVADETARADQRPLSLGTKQARMSIAGAVFVGAVAWLASYRSHTASAVVSHGPVIPIDAASDPVQVDASVVSITHFSAATTDAGVVRVSFRLSNAGDAPNDYPGLAVHWHGVPGADQLIPKNSYAHPPLPFTATDVMLELARPRGATGIDVKIAY